MNKQDIYLVIDDYTPDAGSTIYGVFSTYELAKEFVKQLEDSKNNDYGCNMNKDNTIDIRHEYLYTE